MSAQGSLNGMDIHIQGILCDLNTFPNKATYLYLDSEGLQIIQKYVLMFIMKWWINFKSLRSKYHMGISLLKSVLAEVS